jgi:hypothetical protein
MTTFADALTADVQAALGALHETDTVTVKRAVAVCERAASEIEANLTLLGIEAKRQASVAEARAERERTEQAAREREAKAKAERVAARLARRAPKGKSK